MPVPRDLHGRVIAARFRRRRYAAADIMALVIGSLVYVGSIMITPPTASPFALPATSRMAIGGIAICLALLMLYSQYRSPNWNHRPWGKDGLASILPDVPPVNPA